MAKIKITEMWKVINIDGYPLSISKVTKKDNDRHTRASTNDHLIEIGKSRIVQNCFIGDATRVWNRVPYIIHSCATIGTVKSQIKQYVKALPC